jgi:hypothetical protein
MAAERATWEGYEVHAPEATWVCTESHSKDVTQVGPNKFMPDGIDYFLVFSARDKRVVGIPDVRRLQLRTSAFRVSHDQDFVAFLGLVIDGQMLQTEQWDSFKEVYKRD